MSTLIILLASTYLPEFCTARPAQISFKKLLHPNSQRASDITNGPVPDFSKIIDLLNDLKSSTVIAVDNIVEKIGEVNLKIEDEDRKEENVKEQHEQDEQKPSPITHLKDLVLSLENMVKKPILKMGVKSTLKSSHNDEDDTPLKEEEEYNFEDQFNDLTSTVSTTTDGDVSVFW